MKTARHHNITATYFLIAFVLCTFFVQVQMADAQTETLPSAGQTASTVILSSTDNAVQPVDIPSPLINPATDVLNKDQQNAIQNFFKQYTGQNYNFFGYSLFENVKNAPKNKIGPGYMLSEGDELSIRIWGDSVRQYLQSLPASQSPYLEYTATIDEKGLIGLPELGVVALSGLTIEEAKKTLLQKAKAIYQDSSVVLTVDNPQQLSILFSGEINQLGFTGVYPGDTLVDGLIMAGGINRRGSLRNIVVSPASGPSKTFDLYQVLTSGQTSTIPKLTEDDAVYVNSIGNVALINGQVIRPAIYELVPGDRVADLIKYAGGLMPNADKSGIIVQRFGQKGRQLLEVNLDDQEFNIKNGDIITINPLSEEITNWVAFKGHVWNPDVLQYRQGMRLNDILYSMEQLKPNAYLQYGQIKRLKKQDLQEMSIGFHPDRLISGESDENIELKPHDTIRIFSTNQAHELPQISVDGRVKKPGVYRFVDNMTLENALLLAGGTLTDAKNKNVHIFRFTTSDKGIADMQAFQIDMSNASTSAQSCFELKPDDQIIVHSEQARQESRWRAELRGAVKMPASYPISSKTTLSQIIAFAGNLDKTAYLQGLELYRKSTNATQNKYYDLTLDLLQKNLAEQNVKMTASYLDESERMEIKQSVAVIQAYIDGSRKRPPSGRLVLNPEDMKSISTLTGSPSDILLEDGDQIIIPQQPRFVSVAGEVFQPTSFLYTKNKKLKDYLKMAGGQTPQSDFKAAFVIRISGLTLSYSLLGENFQEIPLMPGDVLVIPAKMPLRKHKANPKNK